MKGIGGRKPRQWAITVQNDLYNTATDGGNKRDAVQVKGRRAYLRWKLDFLISDYSYQYQRSYLKSLEHEIQENFYEHHGRGIERNMLIREQDETIRTLRHKMVHQRNNLAGEKKLIKDLKHTEKARLANISVSNATEIYNYSYEERKAKIEKLKACRAEIGLQKRTILRELRVPVYKLEEEVKEEVEVIVDFQLYLRKGHYPLKL